MGRSDKIALFGLFSANVRYYMLCCLKLLLYNNLRIYPYIPRFFESFLPITAKRF